MILLEGSNPKELTELVKREKDGVSTYFMKLENWFTHVVARQ